MKLLGKLLKLCLLLLLAFGIFAAIYYFSVTNKTQLIPEKLVLSEKNIQIFDSQNAPVKDGGVDRSLTVAYKDIPDHTIRAFVDTEDKRFFSHRGFDVKRIVKAAALNLRSGKFRQGASTISQQLIKNTHLSQEKTLKRKLKEWKLTRNLEKKYTKEEILEKYLNVIYFGHNCFGLRSAANFYFGKEPFELTLADSAILAGLVRSPNNYSPFKNPETCQKRKNTVLGLMLKNGSITQTEKELAQNSPLPTAIPKQQDSKSYLHLVFDELSDISEKKGFTVSGEIEIYTHLDQDLQQHTQRLFETYTQTDYTAIVLDVKSKGIKSYVSTAVNVKRSPGSLIKPLLTYAPAIEENYLSPATPILDEPISYGDYSPKNYDKAYRGYVSSRESLAQSLNIPTVKITESLGVNKCVAYLEKMGLNTPKEDVSLALALGGMKDGFTLSQLVGAYAVFANNGYYAPVGCISKIKIDGNVVYTQQKKQTVCFSEETAYLITDMLKTAVTEGTAKKLRTLPFPIAAKTGTVGTEKGNTDAYALSYTTNDVAAVWLGNQDNSYIDCIGGGLPCNYLRNVNEYLAKKHTPTDFKKPKNVVCVTLDKISYYDTHNLILADDNAQVEGKRS